MVLTAAYGGSLPGVELSVGLDLALEPLDTARVFGASEHLTGQLIAPPHTAPTTKNTVQIDFGERLVEGTESFGLSHVRGRILWQAGNRHILRIHRQMPRGWPEAPHEEADEAAITGRTAPIPEFADTGRGAAAIFFGVPILTPDRRCTVAVGARFLPETLARLRELAS